MQISRVLLLHFLDMATPDQRKAANQRLWQLVEQGQKLSEVDEAFAFELMSPNDRLITLMLQKRLPFALAVSIVLMKKLVATKSAAAMSFYATERVEIACPFGTIALVVVGGRCPGATLICHRFEHWLWWNPESVHIVFAQAKTEADVATCSAFARNVKLSLQSQTIGTEVQDILEHISNVLSTWLPLQRQHRLDSRGIVMNEAPVPTAPPVYIPPGEWLPYSPGPRGVLRFGRQRFTVLPTERQPDLITYTGAAISANGYRVECMVSHQLGTSDPASYALRALYHATHGQHPAMGTFAVRPLDQLYAVNDLHFDEEEETLHRV